MNVETLIRENIRSLEGYDCPQRGCGEGEIVMLDANENPFESPCNRYPDAGQRELRRRVAEVKGVGVDRLVLGNGSDELIDLLIRAVCVPGRDNLVVFPPTYSMYETYAQLNDVEIRRVETDERFEPLWNELPAAVEWWMRHISISPTVRRQRRCWKRMATWWCCRRFRKPGGRRDCG